MRRAWQFGVQGLIPLLLLACLDTKHPCDDGQVFADGVCSPGGSQPSAAAGAAGADSAGAEAGGAGGADNLNAFGQQCDDDVDHSDCAEPAPYCAIQPGVEAGFCTATDCLENPEVCPEGWTCFDLGAFADGLPSICTEG